MIFAQAYLYLTIISEYLISASSSSSTAYPLGVLQSKIQILIGKWRLLPEMDPSQIAVNWECSYNEDPDYNSCEKAEV